MLPWAHGHQRKAIRDFVQAIIAQQTGCQAQLARRFGNQEAATKRLSRLLRTTNGWARRLADAILLQALVQLPAHGPVRLAIDWTIEGQQHLRRYIRDEHNFSLLGQCPAKFTILDSKFMFQSFQNKSLHFSPANSFLDTRG